MSITNTVVGDSIRTRLSEVEDLIAGVEAHIAQIQAERKSLMEERKVLGKALSDIENLLGVPVDNGNGHVEFKKPRVGRQVDYEELKAAVAGVGRPVKTTELAEALGTLPNMIARKLKKLVDDGELGGGKDSGFFALNGGGAAA